MEHYCCSCVSLVPRFLMNFLRWPKRLHIFDKWTCDSYHVIEVWKSTIGSRVLPIQILTEIAYQMSCSTWTLHVKVVFTTRSLQDEYIWSAALCRDRNTKADLEKQPISDKLAARWYINPYWHRVEASISARGAGTGVTKMLQTRASHSSDSHRTYVKYTYQDLIITVSQLLMSIFCPVYSPPISFVVKEMEDTGACN